MKINIDDNVAYGHALNAFVFTAGSIASAYMSKEEFSKLNAEEFADLYLDTMLVAMHKIDERSKNEKKENSFLEDNRLIKFNIRTQNVSKWRVFQKQDFKTNI